MRLQDLIQKFKRVWREEGVKAALTRVAHFAGNVEGRKMRRYDSRIAKKEKGQILFINGCWAEHPFRYRVLHQIERLREAGIISNKVYFEDLELKMENNYDAFIFYRCEYTETVGAFIELAKRHSKRVIFDIDDLIFDSVYTDQVPFVKAMPPETKEVFDMIGRRIQKTLRACEVATTTTEALAGELKQYVPEVLVCRNVVSKEMVAYSEKAYENKCRKNSDQVWLGYFSGSLTHNQDFELIRPAIMKIMETNAHVNLLLLGELEASDQLSKFGDRILQTATVSWRDLPYMIAKVDVNLAPLEDTLFNRAKSEIKWIEAALVRVPTIASKIGAFEIMIENGVTGFLANNTKEEWCDILQKVIDEKNIRESVGNQAYEYVMQNCTTTANIEAYKRIMVNFVNSAAC